jgi:hypothetical protein
LLLVLLGVVALVLLVGAIALRPLARSKTREALAGMKGARGEFQDVDVSLFPLRYTITRLKIFRTDALLKKEPALYAERLTVTLRWAPLLRGVFSGTSTASASRPCSRSPSRVPTRRCPPSPSSSR